VYIRTTINKNKRIIIPGEIEEIKKKVAEENFNSDGDSNGNKKWRLYTTPISEKNF
jgi:hypothetical protein